MQTASGNGSPPRSGPARGQRRSGDPHAQPHHPGLGGLLPDAWCPRRSSRRWTTTCGGSPTGGRRRAHPNKSRRWVTARYFGAFNPARRDRWVFGDRDSGRYLLKFAWTTIVRHQLVQGAASPDDPALTDYWASGDAAAEPPAGRPTCCASRRSPAVARSAGTCCCTPSANRQAPRNGSTGSPRPARRSAERRSPCERGTPDEHRTPSHAHSLRTAATTSPRAAPALLPARDALRACLSRVPGNWHARLYVEPLVMLRTLPVGRDSPCVTRVRR